LALAVLVAFVAGASESGKAVHSTGRKYSWAVCPISWRTCCAFFTPGIDTAISLVPDVLTWAPDTPRLLTRRSRMLTASSRLALETCFSCAL
jgi:hypothetical protein